MEAADARAWLRLAVATPSPSGREGDVVARLADALPVRPDGVGFDDVHVDDAGNLHAVRGHGPLEVLALGHVDTVPGDVPVEERGGALYGRGAVDAKGPLCAALAAVAHLDREVRDALTVRVVGAVGEEAPGSVGARHLLATRAAPDRLVILEPSGWDAVTLGYKGRLAVHARAVRPAAHGAGPADSAADDLVAWLATLRAARDAANANGAPRGAFDALQATVTGLTHEGDGLAVRADATVVFRLPPAWPPDRLAAWLADLPRPPSVTLEIRPERLAAVRSPRDGDLQRAWRTAIRAVGGRPRTVVKTGTSDWNVVADAWPVPTIAYGPGDASLDHTPDEHLDFGAYDAAVDVVRAALAHLAGVHATARTPKGPRRERS